MSVYQQSSFIENCWLWTGVKRLCDKMLQYESLFIFIKKLFLQKAPSKNSCGYKAAITYPFSFIETGWSCDRC